MLSSFLLSPGPGLSNIYVVYTYATLLMVKNWFKYSMLIGDQNFVFTPWILPGRHCIPLETSFDFPVILKIEVNARSTQGFLDFAHSKKKTSILFSCLVPHSSLLPSPPSHQFCLFGITIGSVGTSEDQFVPSVFCPHQTRAVDSSGGPP